MILSFTIAIRVLAVTMALSLPAHAGDWDIPPGLTLPVKYGITGGQILVTAHHPFRIVKMENRGLHGEITIEPGVKHPSASFKAFLSTDGFRSAAANVREAVEEMLDAKKNPELGFISQTAELHQGKRAGESEVAFTGELTLGGTKAEWNAPLSCAITPDILNCHFNIPFRFRDLHLDPPMPLAIPFREIVTIEGEWVATRVVGS